MKSSRASWRAFRGCAALAIIATSALVVAAPLSVADAFKTSPILSMRLSGDGKHLAAFVVNDKSAGILIIDRATMKPRLLRNAGMGYPWLVRWVGNDMLIVATGAEVQVYDGEGHPIRNVDGRFIGSLPLDAEGHERIVVRDAWDYVERIDLRTGRSVKIALDWPDGRLARVLMDRDGVPRIVTTLSRDGTLATHWIRSGPTAPWQTIESQLVVDSRWTPQGISRDGHSLIVTSAEGRDTTAVVRYSLDEHALKEVMAGHPTEDIGSASITASDSDSSDADVGNFLSVVTLGMKTEVHWFDPKWDALQKAVDAALPGRINQLSGSFGSGVMLIFSSGDVDPGTWYVLDLAAMSLKKVDSVKPEIDRAAMRPMQIVRYRSLDGREVPAYLTLPAEGNRNLPAIVLVHGGPVERDRWAWNPEVQMLASRGYAVLQPQFRGSAGFGHSFEVAGYREWGRTMQDDVTAGAEWLVSQGIADPRRMCIYGGSYGGYAALWALVKTPKLFRCGASLAGVSDLRLMFSDDSDRNGSEVAKLMERRWLGSLEQDGALLDEVSPLRNAARVEVPVLLAHGNLDRRVPIVHSEKMFEALRNAGKSVEWIYLRGEGHNLPREENGELYYKTLFDFLARNTAPLPEAASVESAASAPLRP